MSDEGLLNIGAFSALAVLIEVVDDYIENGVRMVDAKPCRVVEINLGVTDVDAVRRFYGRANFGLLVDDLDAVHERAVTAGGTEISPPRDVTGMPRFSSIVDPSQNLINLYQNA